MEKGKVMDKNSTKSKEFSKENETSVVGYLPDEKPSFGKLVLFGLQHVLVMLPATVLVAILTGFPIITTLFASGFATLCFLLITKGKIPLYYGSSFAYLAPIMSITTTGAWVNGIAPAELVSQALFGIMVSGLLSVIAGLVIMKFGKNKMDKILPPTVTGPVAMIIALSLAVNAINDASGITSTGSIDSTSWIVAIVTLLAIVIFTIIFRKGLLSQIPLLLGILLGFVIASIVGMVDYSTIFDGNVFAWSTLPAGYNVFDYLTPSVNWAAVLAIAPIAIATIPESTAHLYQIDLYVNKLAETKGVNKKYDIANRLGENLIGDGVADIASALVGGPAGTNYGENISTMVITKNFSVWVLGAAAILSMIISIFAPLTNFFQSIPTAVIGGAEIYLFGVIAAQGIAIMIDKKVDMFSSKNLAVIAVILIIGIGGSLGLGLGTLPAIATAAIVGIIMNIGLSLLENLVDKKTKV